jgi:hypothetical protein
VNQSDVAKCPKSEKVHDEIAQGRVPLDKFTSPHVQRLSFAVQLAFFRVAKETPRSGGVWPQTIALWDRYANSC